MGEGVAGGGEDEGGFGVPGERCSEGFFGGVEVFGGGVGGAADRGKGEKG